MGSGPPRRDAAKHLALVHDEAKTRRRRDPLLGQTIGGRYRLIEPIGSGAFGTIYRAELLPFGRAVAVKVLKFPGQADLRERFDREAQLLARLTHPNTVALLDAGATERGMPYLVMEHLEGETLAQLMQTEGRLPWRRALRLIRQACDSLSEAHTCGLVHRDLKPEHLFLVREPRDFVKVLDFGLARSIWAGSSLTQKGLVVGSPQYMSPEQASGAAADGRSDIYGLGVVLYEALTGRPPFEASSSAQMMLLHLSHKPPRMPKAARVPRAVERVVLRCLEKEPSRRYESMAALGQALDGCLNGADAASPGHGRLTRTLGIAGLVTLALAVLVGAGFLVHGRRQRLTGAPETAGPRVESPRGPAPPRPPPRQPLPLVLRVQTDPPGAWVTVDEQERGTTPLELPLARGADGTSTALVRLTLAGHVPATFSITGEGQRLELSHTFSKRPPRAKPARADRRRAGTRR